MYLLGYILVHCNISAQFTTVGLAIETEIVQKDIIILLLLLYSLLATGPRIPSFRLNGALNVLQQLLFSQC